MSACDGSGRMIGCPGCSVCEQEMESIHDTKRDIAGLLASLTARNPSPAVYADPWATPNLEENAS